jgi:epoxyqueuosine reductase QueG
VVILLTAVDKRKAIEAIAGRMGAVAFGVADVGEIEGESREVSLAGLPTGIVFGYRLSDVVVEGIDDHPTRTYQYHYRQVNLLLDHIGLVITSALQAWGNRAFPVPSSQIVDWDAVSGHVSHKVIAMQAGLGWIGKNNLLVHPEHGSRLRYASVLTDLVLPYDRPIEGDCGACGLCAAACPGGAIGRTRAEFDLDTCVATMSRVTRVANIGSKICGICIRACPARRRS